jgi:hypothetical protein
MAEKKKQKPLSKLKNLLKDESAFFDKNKLLTATSLIAGVSLGMLPSRASITHDYTGGQVTAFHSSHGSHSTHSTHSSHSTHGTHSTHSSHSSHSTHSSHSSHTNC